MAKLIIEEFGNDHPFAGGKVHKNFTQKHEPMVWENMLGTVMARNPHTKETKYFDYDHKAAREFAGVHKASDLRVVKTPKPKIGRHYGDDTPSPGRWALYGIPGDR